MHRNIKIRNLCFDFLMFKRRRQQRTSVLYFLFKVAYKVQTRIKVLGFIQVRVR